MQQALATALVGALVACFSDVAEAWTYDRGVQLPAHHSSENEMRHFEASVPAPVQLQACLQHGEALLVSWSPSESGPQANMYEVQVASAPGGATILAFATSQHQARLASLLPGVSYWIRARAHLQGIAGFGPGFWGQVGPELECSLNTTSVVLREAVDAAAPSSSTNPPAAAPSRSNKLAETFFFDVLRESEYTTDVDYLTNHNSGDALGTVTLLSTVPTPFNETLANVTLSMYCVEVMKTTIPDTVTTGGNHSFADYVSCNYDPDRQKIDPSHAVCGCECFVDRIIGGQDFQRFCHAPTGGPCDLKHFNLSNCICDCSASSASNSKRFTGMQPNSWSSGQALGRWYSHPLDGECSDDREVGQPNEGSSQACTWKRQPEVRVLSMSDLLKHGWNTTIPNSSLLGADPALARQNEAVFWHSLSRLPLRPWRCGSTSSPSRSEGALALKPTSILV